MPAFGTAVWVHIKHHAHYFNGCIDGVPQWRLRRHGNGSYYRGLPIDTARIVVRQLNGLGFADCKMEDCNGGVVE